MFLSAKVFFDNRIPDKTKLMRETTNMYPEVYRQKFIANARRIAPRQSGGLRKSIVTQVLGNKVTIGWRVPYAAAVNVGYHTVKPGPRAVQFDNGDWAYLHTGRHYHHTGSKGFVDSIVKATTRDMMAYIAGRGLGT